MKDYRIRAAAREDCPRMLELIRDLAEYEKAPEKVVVSLWEFEESGFGSSPVWWGYVAEDGSGRVCGFALCYVRYSTWRGRCSYLEDIYVKPEHRGGGAGSMLFDRIVADARERGYAGVVWQVLDWNEPSIDFYRRRGADLDPEWINCSIYF